MRLDVSNWAGRVFADFRPVEAASPRRSEEGVRKPVVWTKNLSSEELAEAISTLRLSGMSSFLRVQVLFASRV